MRITNVEALILKLPTITDDVDGTQDDLIIRIETDAGIIGYGEVDSSPYVAKAVIDAETSHGVSYGLRELLLGSDPMLIEQLWQTMYAKTAYYGRFGPVIHAMSGVDLALWDIAGKVHGEPVHRLLGARHRERVKAYASSLMPETPREAFEKAEKFRQQGFLAMKFGWGPIGTSLSRDRELFRAVREGAGSDAEIMIDAGQRYTLKNAQRAAEFLAEIEASWLEEPLDPDDLAGYARLSGTSPVPIAAGEAESGLPAFQRLIEEGLVDVVQPDLSRAGGLTAARKIAALAERNGRRCIPHAFKSNILVAASLQFCAATKSADLLEFSVSESPIRQRITRTAFPVVDGCVQIPDRPGLGFEIDADVIRQLTYLRSAS